MRPVSFSARLVILMLLLAVGPLSAATIMVYGTGVDDLFAPLVAGAADSHYKIGPTSASVVNDGFPIGVTGGWIDNSPTSKWIGPTASPMHDVMETGYYIYRTTFSLDGMDPLTAVLTGAWASDNAGVDILLNGEGTGNSVAFKTGSTYSFQAMTAFTIATGFVSGLNTLDFIVYNSPDEVKPGDMNPTGLRVDISGTAELVPEPTTIGLFATGLLLIAGARLRRRRN